MVSVTAAIIRKDGKILLARRSPGQRLAGKWEFPGGKVEEGESQQVCLAREMYEEFGIRVRIGEFVGTTTHIEERGALELCAYEVEPTDCDFTLTVHDAVKWVEPDQLGNEELAPADYGILPYLQ